MVSLRRRRLLGLCTGRSTFLTPRPYNVTAPISSSVNARSTSVHPQPSEDVNQLKINIKVGAGVTDISAPSLPQEQPSQLYAEQPVKRRKRHRRKPVQNQEPCLMRGVYFKNMRWQAAIKVDKKQIHLGTVGSQEEAAHLYDRAAFMCGREPNFELSEEEKQELRKFKWDDFLALTRSTINHKKGKRRNGGASHRSLDPTLEGNGFHGNLSELDSSNY